MRTDQSPDFDELNEPTSLHPDVGTMTALVHARYGTDPAKVLRLAEVGRPAIGAKDVLVHVRAASVGRGTWHIMAGLPYPIRMAGQF